MRNILTTILVIFGVGCGGPPSDVGRRTAPQWMAEVDLPGCVGPGAPEPGALSSRRVEVLLHPLDDRLVVVTSGGVPACITSNDLVPPETSAPGGQTSATADDDPIPLVRERDTPGEGETDDDPIPLVRLADGLPDDDPIPLVRERDLKGAEQGRLPDKKKEN